MMSDRELLEAAAKAAGLPHKWDGRMARPMVNEVRDERGNFVRYESWSPLTDSRDAFGLMSCLWLKVDYYAGPDRWMVCAATKFGACHEECETDSSAATRRAIVRAAASLASAQAEAISTAKESK